MPVKNIVETPPLIIIIIKRISRAPIYHTRWQHRALYNNTNHTHTHTQVSDQGRYCQDPGYFIWEPFQHLERETRHIKVFAFLRKKTRKQCAESLVQVYDNCHSGRLDEIVTGVKRGYSFFSPACKAQKDVGSLKEGTRPKSFSQIAPPIHRVLQHRSNLSPESKRSKKAHYWQIFQGVRAVWGEPVLHEDQTEHCTERQQDCARLLTSWDSCRNYSAVEAVGGEHWHFTSPPWLLLPCPACYI